MYLYLCVCYNATDMFCICYCYRYIAIAITIALCCHIFSICLIHILGYAAIIICILYPYLLRHRSLFLEPSFPKGRKPKRKKKCQNTRDLVMFRICIHTYVFVLFCFDSFSFGRAARIFSDAVSHKMCTCGYNVNHTVIIVDVVVVVFLFFIFSEYEFHLI